MLHLYFLHVTPHALRYHAAVSIHTIAGLVETTKAQGLNNIIAP
jgi:hypothetical protein